MNLRPFLTFAAVAAVSTASLPVTARAAEASETLRIAVDEVLAIAYDAQATAPLAVRVRPVIEKYFNLEIITRRAVGPGWKQFTPEQKAAATQLFTDVVIRTYANRFEPGDRPVIGYGKAVTPDAARPALRELPTTITAAGKTFAVVYRVEQAGESWRIYDVNIEGVSMIANWRSQLDPIFQKGGAAAVIDSLQKNLAQQPAK